MNTDMIKSLNEKIPKMMIDSTFKTLQRPKSVDQKRKQNFKVICIFQVVLQIQEKQQLLKKQWLFMALAVLGLSVMLADKNFDLNILFK